jgi:probable F420-dependent oxidoreductase
MTIPVGLAIRNMGDESTPDLIRHCTLRAESAGLDSVWITDHIAIPPDDAEGSGGRYLDPLATLAWLGGQTTRIRLGTGVLVLPYRPKLALAKWIATLQELTGERLILGVGIGWMRAEFNAVGVPLAERARVSEATLAFIHECFNSDLVKSNGQEFIFKPRPARPLILIGGSAPHATRRALKLGDGWLPMGTDPDRLAPAVKEYREEARRKGQTASVYTFGALGEDRASVQSRLARLEDIGVDGVITAVPYSDQDSFSKNLDALMSRLD